MFRHLAVLSLILPSVISTPTSKATSLSTALKNRILTGHRSRKLDLTYECIDETINLWYNGESPPYTPNTLIAACGYQDPCDFSSLALDDDGAISDYDDRCIANDNTTLVEVTMKFTEEYAEYYHYGPFSGGGGPVRNLDTPFYFEVNNLPLCISKSCDASHFVTFFQLNFGMIGPHFLIYDESSVTLKCMEDFFGLQVWFEDGYPLESCEDQFPCDMLNVTEPELYSNFTRDCVEVGGSVQLYDMNDGFGYDDDEFLNEVFNYPFCVPDTCAADDHVPYFLMEILGMEWEVKAQTLDAPVTSSAPSAAVTGTVVTSLIVATMAFFLM